MTANDAFHCHMALNNVTSNKQRGYKQTDKASMLTAAVWGHLRRPSPIQLGQEAFNDPWEHLVCCLLCR